MQMMKIAVINFEKPDGMARTIIDGLCAMAKEGSVDFRLSSKFLYDLPLEDAVLSRGDFIAFARSADRIFLIGNDKYGYDTTLAEEIDRFGKTVCVDGSEVGKNRRYDFTIQKGIIDGTYDGQGTVDRELLSKCHRYFRREKPYSDGIIALPFGIESRYMQSYKEGTPKDIDFVCIFGQDEYPLLRRFVREALETYCKDNGFTCATERTKTPEEFYKLLARAKVGVSVGGGGFDTMRFWEILGNNCLMLTETIDIYPRDSKRLKYERIIEFQNLFDFDAELKKMGAFLRSGYADLDLKPEYERIVGDHSTKARVEEILRASA
ncbi:MAG: hypothetical protein JWN50_427 [Parcubacteria group bacterium]|nr:hypothetical protein [Parcubacteria group bacterium]